MVRIGWMLMRKPLNWPAGVIAFQGVAAALAGKNGPPDCRIELSWRVPSRESLEK